MTFSEWAMTACFALALLTLLVAGWNLHPASRRWTADRLGDLLLWLFQMRAWFMARWRWERTTCPQRVGQWGPWKKEEGLDRWRDDRWSRLQAWRSRLEQWADPEHRLGQPYVWREVQQPPRSCSFCGSGHPEDAIRLLKAGWEVERQPGHPRIDMDPPGHREAQSRFMKAFRARVKLMAPSVSSPVPPVKFCCRHFTVDQAKRWNDHLVRSDEGTVPPVPWLVRGEAKGA